MKKLCLFLLLFFTFSTLMNDLQATKPAETIASNTSRYKTTNEANRPKISSRMIDSLALVALYNAADGLNWTNAWDLNRPMDTWYGVQLTEQGCVKCLDLDGNPDCIRLINNAGNNLNGIIPAELADLHNLQYLSLSGNELSGNIPPELGSLSNLMLLHLSANQLTGNIPSVLGGLTNLESLVLDHNQLDGSIPVELGNLANLEILSLPYNQLDGTIPVELSNLLNLRTLALNDNQFHGNIPPELGNLSNLTLLHLSRNQFTGNIPPELGDLSRLVFLYLDNNRLDGGIPVELGNLARLRAFFCTSNQLSGEIPAEFGQIGALLQLVLTDNQLSGSIPAELANPPDLNRLSLNDNQLSGNIPPELGNLSKLSYLYLGNNLLTGSVPGELGNLASLRELDIANNQLQCFEAGLSALCNNGVLIQVSASNNPGNLDWTIFCNTGAGTCEDILVSPIVYLQGGYDAALGLMRDNLRTNNLLPLNEPYTALDFIHIGGGGETIEQAVLDLSGMDGVVDWVFLELRDKSDVSLVRAARSALLQRDGDVVDVDGVSPVTFANLPVDDYYLVVRHRNHLGVMSAVPIAFSSMPIAVDFTSDLSQTLGGVNGIADLGDGRWGLYSGDFDHSGQIQNTDFNAMIITIGNSGYVAGDMDLNGQVQNTDLQLELIPNIGRGQAFGQ